jgi:hypothetical protein
MQAKKECSCREYLAGVVAMAVLLSFPLLLGVVLGIVAVSPASSPPRDPDLAAAVQASEQTLQKLAALAPAAFEQRIRDVVDERLLTLFSMPAGGPNQERALRLKATLQEFCRTTLARGNLLVCELLKDTP